MLLRQRAMSDAQTAADVTPPELGDLAGRVAMPWVDSPFFESILAGKRLSPREAEWARAYRRDGYLMFEDSIVDGADLACVDEYVRAHYDAAAGRLQDAWQGCAAVRQIATHPRVLELLTLLYGRAPVPFQTLNFLTGTEQATHSDSIHFSSIPARFMCGVWVALEDVTVAQGPLHYYPGSQALPEYDYYDLGIAEENLFGADAWSGPFTWQNPRTVQKYQRYETLIDGIAKEHGFARHELEIKKGSFLIWSSNLFHGGSRILERGTSRRSQVTHYYFADTIPITPMFSNPRLGEYFVRAPVDISTLAPMARSLNGLPVALSPGSISGLQRIRVRRDDEEARARRYFARYPDVARSAYGTSIGGALRHFTEHGRLEGRTF